MRSAEDTADEGAGGPVPRRRELAQPATADWQALVTEHLEFARKIARRQAFRMPMPPEEVESAAMLGLVQAARAFSRDVGVQFTAYAKRRIEGAIQDQARDVDVLSRDQRAAVKAGKAEPPRHEPMDDLAERLPGEVTGGTVDDWIATRETQELLRYLPKRMQIVVRRHLIDGVTLREAGEEIGVTESRACQILGEAKERLRVRLMPYEPDVNDAHRSQWRKRGCRRQQFCLRGHELTGYNVVTHTRVIPRKTKDALVSRYRVCRRCLRERERRRRWAHGTQPFARFRQPRHKLAKLSDKQVVDVLNAITRGERVTAIARGYGVASLVIRLIRDGKTYRDVPRPAGFTGARRPGGKLTVAQAHAIVQRLAAGASTREVALEFGVSDPTISDIRHGRAHRRVRRPPGFEKDCRRQRNARAKLSDQQVREVRAALKAGVSVASVARRFGVAWNTIGGLRDGKSYRHVEGDRP